MRAAYDPRASTQLDFHFSDGTGGRRTDDHGENDGTGGRTGTHARTKRTLQLSS